MDQVSVGVYTTSRLVTILTSEDMSATQNINIVDSKLLILHILQIILAF